MSAYTAQEELEQLKAWLRNYGGSLIGGVLLGVAILYGYRYWTQHREAERETASALYDQLLDEARLKKGEARASGEKLMSDYSATPYASMAAFLLARQAHEAGDEQLARQRLEWVLVHAQDGATQHAARLRLARLLLDGGDAPAAIGVAQVKDTRGYEAEYQELHGDIALAQGQRADARAAFRDALKYVAAGSPYAAVIRMKLDDLGPELSK